MKVFIFIIIIIFFFTSCKTGTDNTKVSNVETNNVVIETYRQLPELKIKKRVLLIPQNSCGECRNYVFRNYHKLSQIKDLQLIYLKYGDTSVKPLNIQNIKVVNLKPIDKKCGLYGITLYSLIGDSIVSTKELNPTNIKKVIDSLVN